MPWAPKPTSRVKEMNGPNQVKAQNHYLKSTKVKGYERKRIIWSFFALISFTIFGFVHVLLQRSHDPGDGIPHDPFIWFVLWRYLCDVPLSGPVA